MELDSDSESESGPNLIVMPILNLRLMYPVIRFRIGIRIKFRPDYDSESESNTVEYS